MGGPTLLFENINGLEDTLRTTLFVPLLGSFCGGLIAGLSKEMPYNDLIQAWREHIKKL